MAAQTATHRHAGGVTACGEVAGRADVRRQVEAPEEAHNRTRATGRIGLVILQRRKDRVARILLRPCHSQRPTVGLEAEEILLVQNLAGHGEALNSMRAVLRVVEFLTLAGSAVVVGPVTAE